MSCEDHVDLNANTRDLFRVLRTQPDQRAGTDTLPESVLWHAYCELRKRGEDKASNHFVRSMRTLHRRRSLGAVTLPTADPDPVEHKLVDDPLLAELWKAYKRCICSQRTGPAAQLLRDIEDRIATA
jgi:hypothetical protein